MRKSDTLNTTEWPLNASNGGRDERALNVVHSEHSDVVHSEHSAKVSGYQVYVRCYPRLFWARSHLPSYMDAKSDSNMRATASGQFGSVGIALAADH